MSIGEELKTNHTLEQEFLSHLQCDRQKDSVLHENVEQTWGAKQLPSAFQNLNEGLQFLQLVQTEVNSIDNPCI